MVPIAKYYKDKRCFVKKIKKLIVAIVLTMSLFMTTGAYAGNTCMLVFGYCPDSSFLSFDLNQVDYAAVSHLIDTFAIPQNNGTLNTAGYLRGASLVTTAHINNCRAMYSVGGQTGSWGFSSACSATYRATFITNIVKFMNDNNYDGVDIDWEVPAAADKANFTAFMVDLYAAVKASPNGFDGLPKQLTFYTPVATLDAGFDWAALYNACDYAIQSGYGWCGAAAGQNWNAPLKNTSVGTITTQTGSKIQQSIYGMEEMMNTKGLLRAKNIMGLPFYATNSSCNEIAENTITRTGGTYDAEKKEAIINGYYVNTAQSFTDKIAWAKSNGQPGIAIWQLGQGQGATDLPIAIRTASCAGVVPLATATFTPTVDPSAAIMIDNFEDGDMATNLLGGAWTTWADETQVGKFCTVSTTINATYAMGGTGLGMQIKADIKGNTNWPSVAVTTDLDASGNTINISGTTGIQFWQYGTKSATVDYLVMLVTSNITDSSYWRYKVTLPATATIMTIPWSLFTKPSWGQGNANFTSITQLLPYARAINWAISDNTGVVINSLNNTWNLDEIMIYGGTMPTKTATTTVTPTYTTTPTFTSTKTATPTKTFTPTATASNTGTQTNTATATKTGTPTATVSNTSTQTSTTTATNTSTSTATNTNTITQTNTTTATKTATATVSPVFTPTITQTHTASPTITETSTPTGTFTITSTATVTGTATPTFTVTNTSTITPTSTDTPIVSPTPTFTHTETVTETSTDTVTQTSTETATPTDTFTVTFTTTITLTLTNTPTITRTVSIPSATSTPVMTATVTATQGASGTPTAVDRDVVWPNPWNEGKDITVRLKKALSNSVCTVKLYTAAYRLAYQYTLSLKQTGDLIIVNKAKAPTNLAAGVYYLVVEPDNATKTIIKLIVLKQGSLNN